PKWKLHPPATLADAAQKCLLDLSHGRSGHVVPEKLADAAVGPFPTILLGEGEISDVRRDQSIAVVNAVGEGRGVHMLPTTAACPSQIPSCIRSPARLRRSRGRPACAAGLRGGRR